MKYRDYEIWHDEHKGSSKVNEYWHGIFFIPVDKKNEIISFLKQIKKNHNCNENIKFYKSLKKERQGRLIKNNLDLFSHLLIVKENKKTQIYNRTLEDKYNNNFQPFLEITGIFGCKLVLFYIPDNHKNLDKYPMNYASRVETTFRMGFKGGSHLFFSSDNPINITKFYFDGHEHHCGHISKDRILKGDFRKYCNIDSNCNIDDRQISERDDNSKIMISFVDNILGAWVAKFKRQSDPNLVLFSINEIYDRLLNGMIIKNQNSKWYKSISVSKLEIIDEDIKFTDFFHNKSQLSLF